MNTQQEQAFAAGAGISHDAMLLVIASSVILLAVIWVVWLTFGSFQAWREGYIDWFDFLWTVMRASIVLLVLGFYLR